MKRWLIASGMVVAALVMGGCEAPLVGSEPVGESLGGMRYVVDLDPVTDPTTAVWLDDEIAAMAEVVDDEYQAPEVAAKIRSVNPKEAMLVAYYFDACSRHDPQLRLAGNTVTVAFGEIEEGLLCGRAVDTLVFFEVAKADVPDPVDFALCGPDPITIESGRKSGAVSYRMC